MLSGNVSFCFNHQKAHAHIKRYKIITKERKTRSRAREINGWQYSSFRCVYHGRYWGCQSTWINMPEELSSDSSVRAARVPPFSPSTFYCSSLRENSKARKRAFISENRCRRVVLRARVVLDSNPQVSGTRPDVFEYSGTLSRVHAARAYSRFLKAVSGRVTTIASKQGG